MDRIFVGGCATLAAVSLMTGASPSVARAPGLFPERMDAPARATATQRGWTIPDIVEVTRISSTAVDGLGERALFVLKRPSIAHGDNCYALYVLEMRPSETARKLIEAPYLSELEWRPGSQSWTFRADLGAGVQIYEIGEDGKPRAFLINPTTAMVGGSDGLVSSSTEGKRSTGILAYGWAPDGSALWYSKLRLPPDAARQAFLDHGIVYDDVKTAPFHFYREPPAEAIELRLFEPASNTDRLITSIPGDTYSGAYSFSRSSVIWTGTQELVVRTRASASSGLPATQLRRFDVRTGQAKALPASTAEYAFSGAPIADGYLVVKSTRGSQFRLMRLDDANADAVDLGEVPYSGIGGSLGVWQGAAGRSIFGVRTEDRLGLMVYPPSQGGKVLENVRDSLTDCSFDATLTLGICSRESLTDAPELVAVDVESGEVTTLVRPNARYDAITPLRSEAASWINKFGYARGGYITFPRNYQEGQRYPTVVITHASDARNLFIGDALQWAFPLQVLAERDYLVLSVNERPGDDAVRRAYASHRSETSVERMQRGQGLEAVASMEAAVQSLVERGISDPDRVGIAGFSRGGIVTTLTLSQSKMFKVGVSADTSFFSAGGFWRGATVRELYRTLFGGSPLDPRYSKHYRAFSPSARADQFAGPLLQFFTGTSGYTGIELHQALKEANVPTELVVYPDETHLLHRPRTIASAMGRTLDWFDFWLLGRVDAAAEKAAQYRRWQASAARGRAQD